MSTSFTNTTASNVTAGEKATFRANIGAASEEQGSLADTALQPTVATKSTPVDADTVELQDSAASGARKLLTFANLWVWIKSKLDTALTIAGAKTWSGQQELTGQAATNGTSAMTRDLGDLRFIRSSRTTLPTPDFTSAVGGNQTWITQIWTIPAQSSGFCYANALGQQIVSGNFVINASSGTSGIGYSLQILPSGPSGADIAFAGTMFDVLGYFIGRFAVNNFSGLVSFLDASTYMRMHCSGAASRKWRYKFSSNFSANAGDTIVMSPSGHTFIVDDTITDATVWTSATVGGVSVRSTGSTNPPTTSDTSLTVNGGSPITTTYIANTASNDGTHPEAVLFVSSTGLHLWQKTFGSSGYFHITATL